MAQTVPRHNDNAAFSSLPSTKFDVFINHRGPDVKKTFASHIYHRLNSCGLRAFLDEPELVEGRTFPSQIEAAIQSSAIHIAIFSPTYADSEWCLNELIHMIKSEATILPVFYNVEPRELRWTGKDGRGAYFEALRRHEEKKRHDFQTIQNWREALSTAADISGFELKAFNGDEGQLLEEIVRRVLNEVDKTPLKFVAEHPTGLREKLNEFESKVIQRQKEKVVGIVGLGGVGKTTLAKEYFSQRRSHYSRSCFLYDVREKAVNGSLPSLQRKLLNDLTELDLQIDSIDEGIEKLIKHLSSSSHFLIILDDVDDARQLRPFLPIKDILSPSSLILITSRDKKILKIAKIKETSVYELKGLNLKHSKELFCFHAFHQPYPLPEFEDLVYGFLKACDGLPLSLKVFGALVSGENDKVYWQEKLNRLNSILPTTEIHERLKISYESLSTEDQEIFLDIACFFTGEDRDTVLRICGSVGPLLDLENKCLVEVDTENKIKMHDHIRDMGRHIAENVSPHRLWRQQTNCIDDLLGKSSCVNIDVRGVTMDGPSKFNAENTRLLMSEMSWYKRWSHEFFGNCLRRLFDRFRFCGILNLQFVAAEDGYLERIVRPAREPHLQWIRWYKCTHSSLPSWIPMENLKVLEVAGRNLRILWERESQVPRQLRELSICAPLSGFPRFIVQLKHFEKIVICHALFKTLPEELCDVHSLKCLVLRNCSEMISLPDSLEKLTNLQVIDLTNASSLQLLPNSFGNLIGLEYLSLRGCPNLTVSNDTFGNITTLKYLDLQGCSNVKELPPQVAHQQSLVRLDMSARILNELTGNGIGDLSKMEVLDLGGGRLLEMPPLLLVLKNLKELWLFDCPELKRLPNSSGLLTQLRDFNFKMQNCLHWNNFINSSTPSWIPREDLEVLEVDERELRILQAHASQIVHQLREICLENNPFLRSGHRKALFKTLPVVSLLDSLKKLASFQGTGSTNVSSLKMLTNASSLKMFPNCFGNLIRLEYLTWRVCPNLTISNRTFGNIITPKNLDIQGRGNVMELPPQMAHLRSLVRSDVSAKILQELPPNGIEHLSKTVITGLGGDCSLGMLPLLPVLKSSKELWIFDCPKLKCLPHDFGLLSQLTELRIENCPELKFLPDSIGQLIQLTILKMGNCPELKFLPDSFKNLTQLIELKIEKCGIEYLPQDLKMNNLKSLEVIACPLRELPFRRVEGEIETELNTMDKCMFHGGLCPNLQGVCPNLQFFSLNDCKELRQIGRLCGLPKLEVLCFDGCENIEKLSGVDTLISLMLLDVNGCVKLEKIEGLGQLTELPGVERSRLLTIFLSNCPKLQLPQPRCHNVHSAICSY